MNLKFSVFGLALGSVIGCSTNADLSGPGDLPAATARLTGSRVAMAMLAVAAGREGRSFFDNFLPCTRRGVISYFNTERGRSATFSGCDLGGGVVIDGTGSLEWAAPGQRERFCSGGSPSACSAGFTWTGDLTVTGGGHRFPVNRIVVTDLVMSEQGSLFPEFTRIETGDLGFASLTLEFQDVLIAVTDRSLPEDVFDTAGVLANPLPNPGGNLASLTEADMKRVAFGAALDLASFLFNETLETQRGDHTHEQPCGTSAVMVDPVLRLPTITASWQRCAAAGLYFSGSFSVGWRDFTNADRLQMVVEGTLTLEGGVPAITVDELTWIVSFPGGFPGTATISGTIRSGSRQRDFSFDLTLDD